MSESKLTNQIKLGTHLGAMTEDGMLISALNVFNENTEESLQASIDNTYTKEETDSKISEKIAQAKLDGSDVDLSAYATKTDLNNKSDKNHKHKVEDITDLNIDEIGKVKDVRVGNVSVLGDDGVANITLPSSPDLTPYVTKTELAGKGYITSIPDKYVTEDELAAKGYLTEHQDISGKADKTELFDKDYNKLLNLPEIPSVDGLISVETADGKYQPKGSYAAATHKHTTSEITGLPTGTLATEAFVKAEITKAQLEGEEVDLTPFLTKDVADNTYQPKGDYLTKHQSLEGKADKSHTHKKSEITDLDLSVYGKVKDVLVDGSTVLNSSTGVASIDLSGYAKSSEVAENYQPKGTYLTKHQDITGKSNVGHTHVISEITDLNVDEIGKVKDVKVNGSSVVVSGEANVTVPSLTGYAKTADIEKKYQIKGEYLVASDIEGKSDEGHTHTSADITDWATKLAPYAKTANVQAKGDYATNTRLNEELETKASAEHTHKVSDITNLASTLSPYAKTTDVEKKYQKIGNYLTEVPEGYVTEEDLLGKGYVTESSLTGYAKTTNVYTKTQADSTFQKKGTYVTATELENKGYLTGVDIEDKVDRTELSGYSLTSHTHKASEVTGLDIRVKDVKVGEDSIVNNSGVAVINLTEYITAESLESTLGTLETKINGNISSADTTTLDAAKKYADSVASGAMKWKGVKATKAALPSDGKVGDFWTVTGENNSEFAWNGTEWINIGADVDFSQMTADISSLKTSVAGKANSTHSHKASDISDLTTTLQPYAKTSDLAGYQPLGDYLEEIPEDVMKTGKVCTVTAAHTYNSSPKAGNKTQESAKASEIKADSLYFTTGNAVARWWETEKTKYLTEHQPLDSKADVGVSYTKEEANKLLEAKATTTALTTGLSGKVDKTTFTAELGKKVNSSDVYTQDEVDGFLANKADSSDLALKANTATTYSKTEVDNKLKAKANSSDIPNISGLATQEALEGKADATSVYTITQADNKFQVKGSYVTTTDLTSKAYITAASLEPYVTSEDLESKGYLTSASISGKADKTEVNKKANSADVYTITAADEKFLTIADFQEMTEAEILAICK